MSLKKVVPALLVAVIFALLAAANAQETISPNQGSVFIGQHKTVCGRVVSAHYAPRSKGQPTFLSLDKPYPNQVFTVVIWGENRSKFSDAPEILYRDKSVCVTGVIRSRQGSPEIVATDPSQIVTKGY
jgi:hypothetical protein